MSEVGTKLDLARAYMDMGDPEGARNILEEVRVRGIGGPEAGSPAAHRVAAGLSLKSLATRLPSRSSTTARSSPAGRPSRPAPAACRQTAEAAFSRVADEPVSLVCAGRTDAGVHALGQIAHFDTRAMRR